MPAPDFKPLVAAVTTLAGFSWHGLDALGARQMHRTRLALELRLDRNEDWRAVLRDEPSVRDRLAAMRRPPGQARFLNPLPLRLIATCRRKQDGGDFHGTESQRLRVLERIAPLVDFVDVELGAHPDIPAARIIRSYHDFRGVPDFAAIASRMRAEKHHLLKIVGTARCLADNLRAREFLAAAGGNATAFLMGPLGVPSRLLVHAWGGRVSYCSLQGDALAPGMLSLNRFINLYRGHRANARTRIFGVLGAHVEHSLSPWIHNTWLCKRNIDAIYLPLKAVDFADFVAFAAGQPLAGVSVTIPFKEDAARACSELEGNARRAMACNTLLLPGNTMHGSNTDGPGFLADLRKRIGRRPRGMHALVLGAGGSARAVADTLVRAGATVSIWARNTTKAHAMAAQCGATVLNANSAGDFELVINATPCGMAGKLENQTALPWPRLKCLLAAHALVYDLVYAPPRTKLLRQAASAGFQVSNGWGMLVEQAALQARLFGYEPARRATAMAPQLPHVWLVGYRASGKSTLAPQIARALGRTAVDLDAVLEQSSKRSIRDLFATLGEPAFRNVESQVLMGAAKADPAVIATGGGAVLRSSNIRAMRKSGIVVYLDAPENILVRRLRHDANRPSLTGQSVAGEVHEVLARRRPLYEQAAHITVAADKPARVLAGEILARLAQFHAHG